jgi:ubiquitin carboxyl-terminal hydrolase L3
MHTVAFSLHFVLDKREIHGWNADSLSLVFSHTRANQKKNAENNPEVMSHLAQLLGMSPKLGFHDVYSLDSPDLLAFIPRPTFALIFTCPSEVFATAGRQEEKRTMPLYDGSGPDEPVVWFRQDVGHCCGSMAMLHTVCNGGAKDYIEPGSGIEKLRQEAVPLKPDARAKLLYDSAFFEAAHQASAVKGDSIAPSARDPNENHFIAFVKDKGRLWELNGGMLGPLDRGALAEDEDALSEKALDLGVRPFIEAAKKAGIDDVSFSLVAVAPSFD